MTLRVSTAHERDLAEHRGALVELLCACVNSGASIGWVGRLSDEGAGRFWDDIIRRCELDQRVVLLAWVDGRLEGSVQLNIDTPENGVHRAEVCKLLVHPRVRRRGIARALMLRLEEVALERGRTLLLLDTGVGNPAELLYRSLGYAVAGVVPRYALDAGGKLEGTTLMWKELRR